MARAKKEEIIVPVVETKKIKVKVPAGGGTTSPTSGGIKAKIAPVVTQAASSARGRSVEYAQLAQDWAKPRFDQGRAMTGPAMVSAQQAAAAAAQRLAPLVGEARGRVEQAMPSMTDRIAAAIAAGNAARAEVMARGSDAAMVLAGDATIKRAETKKANGVVGGLLTAAGMMAAAGAVAGYLARRSRDREDPWAQPLADPYVAPTSGRDSTVDVPVTGGETAQVSGRASGLDDGGVGDTRIAAVDEAPSSDVHRSQVIDLTDDGMPPEGRKRD